MDFLLSMTLFIKMSKKINFTKTFLLKKIPWPFISTSRIVAGPKGFLLLKQGFKSKNGAKAQPRKAVGNGGISRKEKNYFLNFSLRAFSTCGGTILLMSPPNIASSFMLELLSKRYFWSVGINIVSTCWLRERLTRERSNS